MAWLTNIFGGFWGYLAAAVVAGALAAGGTYYVTSRSYEVMIADMKASQANAEAASATAALDKLKSYVASMDAAGVAYGKDRDALDAKLDALNKEFHNAIKSSPLPADCRPDDMRVRQLTEAVTATNTAATGSGFGETVRKPPAAPSQ